MGDSSYKEGTKKREGRNQRKVCHPCVAGILSKAKAIFSETDRTSGELQAEPGMWYQIHLEAPAF
jgi:hypothetical protein